MREIGQRVTIPSDPTAHLAYYLKCMTSLLGDELHTNIERLTDYANYRRLDDSDIDALIVLCIALSPDKLNGKCMFQNDEMCQSDSNKFFELTAVQSTLAVAQEVMVAGRSTTVRKIMTYKMCWIEEHFLQPLNRHSDRVARIARQLRPSPCATACRCLTALVCCPVVLAGCVLKTACNILLCGALSSNNSDRDSRRPRTISNPLLS